MSQIASRGLKWAALSALGLSVTAPAGAAIVPAYRNAVIADGAAAYYEFETATPTDTVTTDAGGANDGVIQGTVGTTAASATAALGNAYNFSAGNVRITDNAIFDPGTGAFTIELWFNSNASARGDIFNYKQAGNDFGIFKNLNAGQVTAYHNSQVANSAVVAENVWNHLVLTRAASGGAVTMYINGAVAATGTDTGSMSVSSDILIGSNYGANTSIPAIPFIGQIDEVAYYPVQLSAAQVTNHYNPAVPEPASAGLIIGAAGLLLGRRRRA